MRYGNACLTLLRPTSLSKSSPGGGPSYRIINFPSCWWQSGPTPLLDHVPGGRRGPSPALPMALCGIARAVTAGDETSPAVTADF